MRSVLIAATFVTVRYFSFPTNTQPLAPSPQAAPAALPLPDKPSLVVLPFDNLSKDPAQDYFSNGITEVLTSDLSRISSLFVIARNTAFTYQGKPVNLQAVGKELGVRYVLQGSVQKAGEQIRIVTQLLDTTYIQISARSISGQSWAISQKKEPFWASDKLRLSDGRNLEHWTLASRCICREQAHSPWNRRLFSSREDSYGQNIAATGGIRMRGALIRERSVLIEGAREAGACPSLHLLNSTRITSRSTYPR